VPLPTSTASTWSRRSWTKARASGPVTQRESPLRVAMRPSSEAAIFRVTSGRPVVIQWSQARLSRSQASSSTPSTTSTPPRRSRATPLPLTTGLGSFEPTSTRRTPAWRMARLQGGVLPQWSQGSSVV